MIGVIFMFASEMIEVRVRETEVLFRSGSQQGFAPIDGLQLSYSGVIKEFPDLENTDDWKLQTIDRFKEKIKNYATEKERIEYIIEDLGKHGYIPKYIQKGGHRAERIE